MALLAGCWRKAPSGAAPRPAMPASTLWMRHTHASRAIAAGVPGQVAQQNPGHASAGDHQVYVKTDTRERLRKMEAFRGRRESGGGWFRDRANGMAGVAKQGEHRMASPRAARASPLPAGAAMAR